MEQAAKVRMIEAALDLFHQKGVNGTSVDQVLAKSKTGKSQFSHYFKNKEGLIHSVIEYLHEIIKAGQTPTGYDVNTWEDLNSWFDKYIYFQKSVKYERSCPLGTISADITNDQKLLRQDILRFLEWCRSKLTRFFAERKAAGDFVSDVDPEGLADLCISVMQGGMLLTKMARGSEMFESAAKQTLSLIHSLRK